MAIPSPRGPSAPDAASRRAATRGDAQNRARETLEPRMPLGEAPTTSEQMATRARERDWLAGGLRKGSVGHYSRDEDVRGRIRMAAMTHGEHCAPPRANRIA